MYYANVEHKLKNIVSGYILKRIFDFGYYQMSRGLLVVEILIIFLLNILGG